MINNIWKKIRAFLVQEKIRPLVMMVYLVINRLMFFIPKKIIIFNYLRKNKIKKLQIGCGTNLITGWLNTDLYGGLKGKVYLDVTKKLPFANESFDYIFSEHLIEHINYQQAEKLIKECFRILKPGGVIRVATPNLLFLVDLYKPKKTEIQEKYIMWAAKEFWNDESKNQPAFIINNFVRNWGHQFIYDLQSIGKLLQDNGFYGIKEFRPKVSDNLELNNLEMHGGIIGEEFNLLESLVIEGVKK